MLCIQNCVQIYIINVNLLLQEMVRKQNVAGHKPSYQASTRLPNEINVSNHMTRIDSNDPLHHNGVAKQRDISSESWKLRNMISETSNIQVLSVEEPTRYSSSQVLINLVKDHELELERIDQELLELGPFAKDTIIPENSHTRQEICPPPILHQYNAHSSASESKRRKSRVSTNSVPSPKQVAATGSRRTSQGLGEHSMASPSNLLKHTQEEKELVKEPPKRKWRKVGSASSNSSRQSSNDGSVTKTSSATTPTGSIDTKTIIPAASEKEMLSLYLPSESSCPRTEQSSLNTTTAKTCSPSSGEQQVAKGEGIRTFTTEHFHPIQTVSSSTPSSLTTTVARHSHIQLPRPHGTRQSSQSELIVVDDTPASLHKLTSNGYSRPSGSGELSMVRPYSNTPIPGDLSRHVVVSGGIPISRSNSYTTNSHGSPRPRLEEPPRGLIISPSDHMRHLRNERSTASPQLPHPFVPPPSLDRRRNSSASSFASSHDSLPASFMQPPGSTKTNSDNPDRILHDQKRATTTPQAPDAKMSAINPYMMYNKPPEGTPTMPGLYPSPFFTTLPTGMVVPSFGPNMLFDPATGIIKQSMGYGPLVQYRYPFPGAPNLKPFQTPTPPPGSTHPSTPTVIPQQPLYTLPSSPGMSAFKNVQDSRSNAATPPSFVRVGSSPLSVSRDENRSAGTDDKPPGINWNPALMGPNLGMMPFPLGIGVPPTSLPQPTSMMNVFNPGFPVPPAPGIVATNSDGDMSKLPGKDRQWISQSRQGTNSIDGSGSSHSNPNLHHQAANLQMTGSTPLQMQQHMFLAADISKWKDKSGNSPPLNMGIPFSSMPVPHKPDSSHFVSEPQHKPGSRGGTPNSRRRTEGKSSPKVPGERLKLRIHQVKDDDFKNASKVDGRKRRGRAKDKVVAVISQSPFSEESPTPKQTPKKAEEKVKSRETLRADVPTTLRQDDNHMYGLNILAAMSSMQKREEDEIDVVPTSNVVMTPHAVSKTPLLVNTNDSLSKTDLPSPVSLAGAQSLLLLGNDVPSPDKEKSQQLANEQNVKNSIVDSLLKLSGSVSSSNNLVHTGAETIDATNTFVVQGRETRSASFSAAEAMLLMVETENDEEKSSVTKQPAEEVFGTPPGAETDDDDSESTDTDSEATLTPCSPSIKVPRKQVAFSDTLPTPAQPEEDSGRLQTANNEFEQVPHSPDDEILDVPSENAKSLRFEAIPIASKAEINDLVPRTTRSDKLPSYPELNTPPLSSPIQPNNEEQPSSQTDIDTLPDTKPDFLDSPDSLENSPLLLNSDEKISNKSENKDVTYDNYLDAQDLSPTLKQNSSGKTANQHSVCEDDSQTNTMLSEIDKPDTNSSIKRSSGSPLSKLFLSSGGTQNVATHGNRLPSWSAFADVAVSTESNTVEIKLANARECGDGTDKLDTDLISVSATVEEIDDLLEIRKDVGEM